MKKNNSIFVLSILLVLWVYWVTVACSAVETFDLNRCYFEASRYVDNYSLSDMIIHRLRTSGDFIYYFILYFGIKASIPLNLVTTFIVSLYYLMILYFARTFYGVRVQKYFFFIALFATPAIWVASMSRNLTAFVFLYLAIFCYYKKMRLFAILFCIIAVFTHLSVLMYVSVLFLCVFLRNKELKHRGITIVLTVVLIMSFLYPSMVQDLFFSAISDQDLRYENYSKMAVNNILFYGSVNYADKVPALFAMVYSVVLLFLGKKKGFDYWGLLLLTSMLMFFINSSWTLVNRCMMFMPIFWGGNVARVLQSGLIQKEVKYLQVISYIGFISILLNLYGNRHIYF